MRINQAPPRVNSLLFWIYLGLKILIITGKCFLNFLLSRLYLIFCLVFSFEQLLINYCNEKLQFHFNNHIFVMEQEAYKLEGIAIDYINFRDNSSTLAVIEEKTTGILSMIEEEINIPKGSDC